MRHDLYWIARMLRAPILDEDGNPIGFWEKLGVMWQVLCGIIVIEHVRKR